MEIRRIHGGSSAGAAAWRGWSGCPTVIDVLWPLLDVRAINQGALTYSDVLTDREVIKRG
jgi:hypothetical protein